MARCLPGPSAVAVEADGFGPGLRTLTIPRSGDPEPVDLTLRPGSTLRVRVVDPAGQPVAGVFWANITWRGRRILQTKGTTDAEGRFEWRNAPPDAVELTLSRLSYQNSGNITLTAGPDEQTVTLHPELVVAGRVTDATTGAPVPRFTIALGSTPRDWPGPEPASWREEEPIADGEGRFARKCEYSGVHSCALRIAAPGYRVVESRAYRPDEGSQTWDVALQPEAWLGGVVLRPDGQPAAGAEVTLPQLPLEPNTAVIVRGGTLRANQARSLAQAVYRTDAAGRFEVPPPTGPFRVVAASVAGFAELTDADFRAADSRVQLLAWGRVEGRLLRNGRPASNEPVIIDRPQSEVTGAPGSRFVPQPLILTVQARTDAEGRFRFDQVAPGPIVVARPLSIPIGPVMAGATYGQTPVMVAPGATAEVVVEPHGRTVVGRVVPVPELRGRVDWEASGPIVISARPEDLGRGPRGWTRYAALFDRDGRFRVEGVPAGRYAIHMTIRLTDGERIDGREPELIRLDIDVPEGDDAAAVNLGDFRCPLVTPPVRPARIVPAPR